MKSEEGSLLIRALQKPIEVTLNVNLPMKSTDLTNSHKPLITQFVLGGGLPFPRVITRYPKDLHVFAYDLFDRGVKSGKNVTALEAVVEMQKAKNSDGSYRFPNWRTWFNDEQVIFNSNIYELSFGKIFSYCSSRMSFQQ